MNENGKCLFMLNNLLTEGTDFLYQGKNKNSYLGKCTFSDWTDQKQAKHIFLRNIKLCACIYILI